jgi:hypothetical protein
MARWPDYVLRGAAAAFLLLILVRVFGADDAPTTTSAPSIAQEADPTERDLLASVSHQDAVWEKVAFVLRRLGHIGDDSPVTDVNIRAGLKRYQHTVALREDGILSRDVLDRILDERVVLTSYLPREAEAHGRWFLAQIGADCSVSTGAVSVEGRVLATQMPALRIVANQSASDGAFKILFAPEDLFDASKPLILSGGGDDLAIKRGATRDVIRSLKGRKDDVVIKGASIFGGPLRLRFPAAGFNDAFAALRARCGDGFPHSPAN